MVIFEGLPYRVLARRPCARRFRSCSHLQHSFTCFKSVVGYESRYAGERSLLPTAEIRRGKDCLVACPTVLRQRFELLDLTSPGRRSSGPSAARRRATTSATSRH